MIINNPGVLFGDHHSFDDYGLLLTKAPFPKPPEVREYLINIPGGNGAVDVSEALAGEPTYAMRTMPFEFKLLAPQWQWAEIHQDLLNDLHGQSMEIRLDDDPGYYYKGRVKVSALNYTSAYANVTITVTADPFKYEEELTIVTAAVPYKGTSGYVNLSDPYGTPMYDDLSQMRGFVFGGEDTPKCDFSWFDNIQLHWTPDPALTGTAVKIEYMKYWNGDLRAMYSVEVAAENEYHTISASIDTEVDISDLRAIRVWPCAGLTISGQADRATLVSLEGCAKSVVPYIYPSQKLMNLFFDGKSYVLGEAEPQQVEEAVIRTDGSEMLFKLADNAEESDPAQSVIITYRKARL